MSDERHLTLSGKPADPDYHGPAPQSVDPATQMHKDYWVLSADERAKGFVHPVRLSYRHLVCGQPTQMHPTIAETFARQPGFYSATFCAHCKGHFPVGASGEFEWSNGEKVGT